MTSTKLVTLYCDDPHCLASYETQWSTVPSARREAGRDGWIYILGFDYCPQHGPPATQVVDPSGGPAPTSNQATTKEK